MSIARTHHNKDYTCMSNRHFRDKNLSLKAKGLLSLMLSLPDEWDYSVKGLASLSSDGDTSVRSAVKELEDHKYLKRTPVREKGKIIDWEYDIYEIPQLDSPPVENPQLDLPLLETKDNKVYRDKVLKDKTNKNKINKLLPENTKNSSYDTVIDLYHKYCTELPKVRAITDKRKKGIQKLLKTQSIETITEAFKKANKSSFLTGKKIDWKADFDFLLREDKFISLMEGKYDDRGNDSKYKKFGENSKMAEIRLNRHEDEKDEFVATF